MKCFSTKLLLILFFSSITSNIFSQQYIVDSIVKLETKNNLQQKQYPSIYNKIANSKAFIKQFDGNLALLEIQTLLSLANISDTNCIFYQKAKLAINRYIQLSMKENNNENEAQLDYIKNLQFNLFKEGFLYDLYTNMETYKTGMYFIGAKNYKSALKHLEMAVSQDNPLAMVKMAEIFLARKNDDEDSQMDQAINYLEMAADQKFVMAIPMLLKLKLEAKEDFNNIMDDYKEYINFGVTMYEPICMYFKGKNILEKANYQSKKITNNDAYIYLNAAANYNIFQAMEELIWMHCKGVGTFASQNEAYYWLEKLKSATEVSNAKILEFEDCIKSL